MSIIDKILTFQTSSSLYLLALEIVQSGAGIEETQQVPTITEVFKRIRENSNSEDYELFLKTVNSTIDSLFFIAMSNTREENAEISLKDAKLNEFTIGLCSCLKTDINRFVEVDSPLILNTSTFTNSKISGVCLNYDFSLLFAFSIQYFNADFNPAAFYDYAKNASEDMILALDYGLSESEFESLVIAHKALKPKRYHV